MLFQRPCIHPDAEGTAVILGGFHHLGDALGIADIAGVDAQAGSACNGGFNGAFVVEMNVGHDGHRAFGHDGL